jgi:hypothetical protein
MFRVHRFAQASPQRHDLGLQAGAAASVLGLFAGVARGPVDALQERLQGRMEDLAIVRAR